MVCETLAATACASLHAHRAGNAQTYALHGFLLYVSTSGFRGAAKELEERGVQEDKLLRLEKSWSQLEEDTLKARSRIMYQGGCPAELGVGRCLSFLAS